MVTVPERAPEGLAMPAPEGKAEVEAAESALFLCV
jgi:hypothetical protein